MEQRSNIGVVMEAKGHVLIAGLGIGMILLPLLEKPEVKSVTVVEKYADVVKLVEPHVLAVVGKNAPKLKTIVADIFEWVPPKGEKWDTIYFDIWPDLSMDNLEQMEILHRKFARRKAPGAWMYSWQKDYLKYRKRAGW
jgi:spermidine synthase